MKTISSFFLRAFLVIALLMAVLTDMSFAFTSIYGPVQTCAGKTDRITISNNPECDISDLQTDIVVTNGTFVVISDQTNSSTGIRTIEIDVTWGCTGNTGSIAVTEWCPSYSGGQPTPSTFTFGTNFIQNPQQLGSVTGPTSIECCAQGQLGYLAPWVICGASYNWTYPAGWQRHTSSDPALLIVTPNASGGGSVSVTITDYCGNPMTTPPLPITRTPLKPTITMASSYVCVCPNSQITLIANIGSGFCADNTSLSWTLPNGWTLNSTSGNTATVTVGNSSGTVSVTATTPCGVESGNLVINLNDTPPQLNNLYVNIPDCPGEFGTVSIGTQACIDHVDWEIDGPGNLYGSGNSVVFTITGTGLIDICATATNDCGAVSNTKCTTVYAITNGCGLKLSPEGELSDQTTNSQITEDQFDNALSITPNPTSGLVEVKLQHLEIISDITLVDGSGRMVRDDITPGSSIKLDLQDVASGHYYLVIRTHQFTVVRSIEVIR